MNHENESRESRKYLNSPCGENQAFNVVYMVFLIWFKTNHV